MTNLSDLFPAVIDYGGGGAAIWSNVTGATRSTDSVLAGTGLHTALPKGTLIRTASAASEPTSDASWSYHRVIDDTTTDQVTIQGEAVASGGATFYCQVDAAGLMAWPKMPVRVVQGIWLPNAASYTDPLSTGDRTGTITVTTSGIGGAQDETKLVDGNFGSNISEAWAFGGADTDATGEWVQFDFGAANAPVITEAKWYQSSTDTHGTWRWQGSADAASWTDIGASFILGGATPHQVQSSLSGNTTGYRYYRLLGISGTPQSANWIPEVEFKIADESSSTILSAYAGMDGGIVNKTGSTIRMIGGDWLTRQENDGASQPSINITVSGNNLFASGQTVTSTLDISTQPETTARDLNYGDSVDVTVINVGTWTTEKAEDLNLGLYGVILRN